MSVRQAAAGAPARTRVGIPATNRLEKLYKMSAPIGMPPDLGDDIIMYIILMSADVYNSIAHADQVLSTRYFSEDGYAAIQRLCQSLQTITSWRQTNKQANAVQNAMMEAAMNSITAKLRQFLDKVNYWQIENRNGMADDAIKRKIIEMCDHLRELYDTARASTTKPPTLSRQRNVQQRERRQYQMAMEFDWQGFPKDP